jgi:hypothetical protein
MSGSNHDPNEPGEQANWSVFWISFAVASVIILLVTASVIIVKITH